MKKRFIMTLLVFLAMGTMLFASGAKDKLADFQSLDLETSSVETIEKTWNNAVSLYSDNVDRLQKAMAQAYEERNVKEYTECRELLRTLAVPEVTKEQTETLVARFEKATEEEKKELSSFLASASRYYHPTLTFSYEASGDGFSKSFKSSVAVAPGSAVTAPKMDMGEGKFLGWGTEEGEVLYAEGAEILMPYADQTLYAIFTNGITFRDPLSDNSSFVEGSSAAVPEVLPTDEGYVFKGWYDRQGNLLSGDTVTVEEGKSATYTAGYEKVIIDTADDCEVPANRLLKLKFSLDSVGNCSLKDVTVTLAESDNLKVNGKSILSTSYLGAGSSVRGSYEILLSGNSGDIVETSITVTDGEGHTWTEPIVFTIK